MTKKEQFLSCLEYVLQTSIEDKIEYAKELLDRNGFCEKFEGDKFNLCCAFMLTNKYGEAKPFLFYEYTDGKLHGLYGYNREDMYCRLEELDNFELIELIAELM